ncbi:MAG: arsenate reductase ArsC [Planctomycetes bacterium]|nr:arsenate reductase ArsC [Planctomycetota bacterium]
MTESEKLKVLFLCTGNACRSQMAEGWANYLKSDSIVAFSAGTNPAGLSKRATQVMAEAGVDISEHTSKYVDDLAGLDFDYVVTVCDNAKEQCPVFSGDAKMVHKSFDDPAGVIGTLDEVLGEFRRVRDEIKAFVETMPASLENA